MISSRGVFSWEDGLSEVSISFPGLTRRIMFFFQKHHGWMTGENKKFEIKWRNVAFCCFFSRKGKTRRQTPFFWSSMLTSWVCPIFLNTRWERFGNFQPSIVFPFSSAKSAKVNTKSFLRAALLHFWRTRKNACLQCLDCAQVKKNFCSSAVCLFFLSEETFNNQPEPLANSTGGQTKSLRDNLSFCWLGWEKKNWGRWCEICFQFEKLFFSTNFENGKQFSKCKSVITFGGGVGGQADKNRFFLLFKLHVILYCFEKKKKIIFFAAFSVSTSFSTNVEVWSLLVVGFVARQIKNVFSYFSNSTWFSTVWKKKNSPKYWKIRFSAAEIKKCL